MTVWWWPASETRRAEWDSAELVITLQHSNNHYRVFLQNVQTKVWSLPLHVLTPAALCHCRPTPPHPRPVCAHARADLRTFVVEPPFAGCELSSPSPAGACRGRAVAVPCRNTAPQPRPSRHTAASLARAGGGEGQIRAPSAPRRRPSEKETRCRRRRPCAAPVTGLRTTPFG